MCPEWNNCQLQKIVSIYEIFVVFIYVLLIFHTCSLYTCSLYAVPCATLLYCTLNLVHLLSVYFLIPKFFQGTFSYVTVPVLHTRLFPIYLLAERVNIRKFRSSFDLSSLAQCTFLFRFALALSVIQFLYVCSLNVLKPSFYIFTVLTTSTARRTAQKQSRLLVADHKLCA
jgi:hypothetical protein